MQRSFLSRVVNLCISFAAVLSTSLPLRAEDADLWTALTVHWDLRQSIISLQADAVGPGAILLIGDSLIESFAWDDLSGCRIINAGFAGIWTEKLAPRVPAIVKATSPSAIVLLVGTNDADPRKPEDWQAFTSGYTEILDDAEQRGIPITVVTPPPFEAGKGVASLYSKDRLDNVIRILHGISANHKARIIDLNSKFSGDDGYALNGTTADGIHLSGKAQNQFREMLTDELAAVPHKCLAAK
ncbi:lysophospholipase L1-like esterase [Rhizobium pisi]